MTELRINGIHYSQEQLLAFCTEQLKSNSNKWECDVYAFILEWMNSYDTITAHTSGSTGTPKQIKLSKQKMLASARMTGEFFQFEKAQTALLCLSPNFIAGKMMVVRAILWQLNLILVEPNGHPLQNINMDIDFAAMIPLQVNNSLNDGNQINRIKKLLIGGGAVDQILEEKLQDLKCEAFSSYGMTETVSHVAIKALNGSCRSETYHTIGKVQFSKDNRGCLLIHAPEILEKDLLTNDMVKLQSDKEFKWIGRFDNVVNSGGIKLFPEQIEDKIRGILSVSFFCAGLPDAHLGQKLVLVLELEEQTSAYKIELMKQLKSLLGKYEQARDIIFIPQFRRTSNGKIQRDATLLLSKSCK
ncbi:AMP-binding protein [Ancylomarina longa]|uniref:AMP-dependent synthetase n=1 Tax=Ancylomarina longa TaxID=2487017 RepID=A0A434AF83_9BACT|nr:AMP-binding protein [Ancylomarina longa]RUT73002.1 AMP-dependent synthetase [Ancylomarina longa]